MAFEKCIDEVVRASGRNDLTDVELDEIGKQVDSLVRKTRATDGEAHEAAFLKEIDDFNDEMIAAAIIEKRNAALNRRAKLQAVDYIRSTWSDSPAVGLTAFLGGVATARRGARASVAASQEALHNHYVTGMVARLEKEGVHSVFVRGVLDRETWIAMHELSTSDPSLKVLKDLPDDAVTIAKILNDYNEVARIDANLAGAWIKKLPGRVIKQTHDQYRISRAGWDTWREFTLPRLDWEKTLPNVADREKALLTLYTQFASGEHVKFREGGVSGFKGFSSVGKKMSHERVLHFKDAESSFEYNKKFGAGTLAEGMVYGLERMAQDTALMRGLGPNAEANLDAVIDTIRKDLRSANDVEGLQKFSNKARSLKATLWPNITGEARVAGSKMGAQLSMGVRALQQMTKLGSAVLSAIADIPFYGSEVRYQGGSMLKGMGEAMQGLLSGRTSVEQKEIIGMLGVLHDGMRASVAARFDVSDNIPGRTAKATQLFFKLNGLRWWTDRLRINFALARSHRLALNSSKSLKDLGDDMTRVLDLFDIDEGKWDIIRAGKTTEADGRAYLTPEGIDNVGDEFIARYIQSKGRNPTKASIRDMRIKIKSQFRSYFYDRSTTAVIEPDARTRGMLLRGTRPGTVEGEFLRHIMLFKSFIASVIQKPLAREIHGRSPEVGGALGRIMRNGNGELTGLAQLIVWNTMFGYAAMTAKDLSKGKTPRDPDSVKTWMAAMVQGGSLGIYGDFLFGDMKNRFGGSAISTLMGPTAGTFDDVVDLAQRFRDGDDTAAQAFRFAVNNTPFINMFYSRLALDHLILWRISENLSPGYLRRMERRTKKNTDQDFLVSPSQAIR